MNRSITKETRVAELRLRLFEDGYERFMGRADEIKRDALRGEVSWTQSHLKTPGLFTILSSPVFSLGTDPLRKAMSVAS